MHSSRMRTARSLPQRARGLCPGRFLHRAGLYPGESLSKGGLCLGVYVRDPQDRDHLEGTWNQAPIKEVTSYRDPLPRGQNDRCE